MATPLVKPTVMVEPFAVNGQKNDIPTDSQIGVAPGRASLNDGFPPLTMTPIIDGGVPPSGLDFNGILNRITQHTAWQNAGGIYHFDDALCAHIGGYPAGAVLLSDTGIASYISATDNNTVNFNDVPESIGITWLPYAGESVAQIDSPAFTGNPTAPTPDPGDNDTSIATTEFVKEAIDNAIAAAGTPLYQLYFMGQL